VLSGLNGLTSGLLVLLSAFTIAGG
jgi:hypothetical protein